MKSSLFTFCAWLLESIQAERQTVDIIVTVPFNRTDSFGEIYPFSRYFVHDKFQKFGARKFLSIFDRLESRLQTLSRIFLGFPVYNFF
jgi:hypothetical protein